MSTAPSAPPLSIRDRSSSSLTIWTRWPVSSSILPIRSRILAGTASPAASASRVSVSARRLTVVSGVRSSCERLSMNSVRICWSRRSSETSSRTSQAPPDGLRRARSGQPRSVGAAEADLADRRPGGERRSRERLDAGVEERLDEGPPHERRRLTVKERMRGRVGRGDPQSVVDPQDARP